MITKEEILEKLPKAPAGVEGWVREHCIEKAYILYNNKMNEAVCTRCGKRFKVPYGAAHNVSGICLKCGEAIRYKEEWRGRKNITEYFRVVVYTHRGNTVYASLTEVQARFCNFGIPELYKEMTDIYVINGADQMHIRRMYSGWSEIQSMKLAPPIGYGFYCATKHHDTYTYSENLEKVFRKSCLKYQWNEPYVMGMKSDTLMGYITKSAKYSSIEKLIKVGLYKLAEAKIKGTAIGNTVNIRGASLEKILKLPPADVRRMIRHDASPRELSAYQKLSQKERNLLDWDSIQWISRSYKLDEILEQTTIVKWIEYVKRLEMSQGSVEYLWTDYIRMAKIIGLDLDNKRVKFPIDLKEAHDEALHKIKIMNSEEKDRRIKAVVKYQAYEKDDFIAYTATSLTELIEESSQLHHCVKTYGERIINKRSLIWFIRKKSELGKSYYTMETSLDGKLIQCRGDRNCGMTDEVEEFVNYVITRIQKREAA